MVVKIQVIAYDFMYNFYTVELSVAWNQMAGTPSNSQILFLYPDNFVVNSLVNEYDFSDYFNFPIIRNKLLKLFVTPNTFCQSLQVWTIEVQLYVLLVTYTFSYGSFFFQDENCNVFMSCVFVFQHRKSLFLFVTAD